MTRKDKIANFLYRNPRSTISVIADAVATDNSQCSCTLSKLVSEGKAIREKCGLISYYSAAPDYEPVDEIPDYIPTASPEEITRQEKLIADLEKRGLYRWAQTELERLAGMQCSSVGVGLIAQRRNQSCLRLRATARRVSDF